MFDAMTGMLAMATVGMLLFARRKHAPKIVLVALGLALALSVGFGFYKIQLVGGLLAGAVLALFTVGLCRGAAQVRILTGLAAVCLLVGLCACQPTASVNTTGDQPAISQGTTMDTIEQVEACVKSIKWIVPLAQGVIAIFAPELIPALSMAVVSYNALTTTADQLIARYKGDPAAADPIKLTDMLAQLRNAWRVLDGSYKADTAPLLAVTEN